MEGFSMQDREFDLSIERKQSTIPGAGIGMFATTMLQRGEVVCEYNGTVKYLDEAGITKLEELHENDGNGVIQVQRAGGSVTSKPGTAMSWVMDPYLYRGNIRKSVAAPGVWANHCVTGRPGCNMKLIKRLGLIGAAQRIYLVTTTCIPQGMELMWDYCIRDVNLAWLN